MIRWTDNFGKKERLRGFIRLLNARIRYNEYYSIGRYGRFGQKFRIENHLGDQDQIAAMRNRYLGNRCFILGNGPSLKKMNLDFLKDEITIGSNGIYGFFKEMGFTTKFLLFEDVEQTEIRAPDIHKVKGPIKMAALYNAYCIKRDSNTLFFNAPRSHNSGYYWDKDLYPQFSRDFSSVVHLGATVTYIALQLAYHLGCNPVYLIGVDHNYGKLPSIFPPGKIEITKENLHLVQQCHFDKNYYKIGDLIGVPWVKGQELSYQLAKEEFIRVGRTTYNAGIDSKLTVYPHTEFNRVFL